MKVRLTWTAGLLGLVGLLGLSSTIAGCSSSKPDANATPTTRAQPAFTPLNRAVGYGLLRVMTLEEQPGPLDVVIYAALPNELPRVAGVITTVGQTPLSHVNLRAVQDNIPNAVISNALSTNSITSLVGKYVRYEVGADGFTLKPATQHEVEQHFASTRPESSQQPARDLSRSTIARLDEIAFTDSKAFGVKAANLAALRRFELVDVDVPDGFAVPFSFYDDFMKENDFYGQVKKMIADPKFTSDPAEQDRRLAELRKAIAAAPMNDRTRAALDTVQRSFAPGTPIRCRSSTNNEDLEGFSGAGLYDSTTHRPSEGHLAKCVRKVYASVWNLRAFLERDFYRIDHFTTAMGVLLHPNFSNEKANGVAVSADPVYDNEGAYYVNTQLGEDLVTNPGTNAIPEEMLVYSDGTSALASHSSLIPVTDRLLSPDQIATLRTTLGVVHDRFADLYGPVAGERFAIEVEFKITADGRLAIKQARPWVFN